MIRIDRHPNGPRVYLAGLRVHHGSAGLLLGVIATLTGHRRLAAGVTTLVVHDAADFPWRDRDNH